jgi:hypothetical protein
MQNPTEQAEASIPPTETTVNNNRPNMTRTVTVRRVAAKRTHPSEPLLTATDEAARETASTVVSVGLSPPTADNDDANTNADLLMDTQPNAGASTRATRRLWTLEEDATLTSAVTDTSKTKCGKECKISWAAVAALVPCRTENSVGVDGIMSWIPVLTERLLDARVYGQQTKTPS